METWLSGFLGSIICLYSGHFWARFLQGKAPQPGIPCAQGGSWQLAKRGWQRPAKANSRDSHETALSYAFRSGSGLYTSPKLHLSEDTAISTCSRAEGQRHERALHIRRKAPAVDSEEDSQHPMHQHFDRCRATHPNVKGPACQGLLRSNSFKARGIPRRDRHLGAFRVAIARRRPGVLPTKRHCWAPSCPIWAQARGLGVHGELMEVRIRLHCRDSHKSMQHTCACSKRAACCPHGRM